MAGARRLREELPQDGIHFLRAGYLINSIRDYIMVVRIISLTLPSNSCLPSSSHPSCPTRCPPRLRRTSRMAFRRSRGQSIAERVPHTPYSIPIVVKAPTRCPISPGGNFLQRRKHQCFILLTTRTQTHRMIMMAVAISLLQLTLLVLP